MLSIDECKKILKSENRDYSDEEVDLIRQFLWKLAKNEVHQLMNTEKNEDSSFDGTCQLG